MSDVSIYGKAILISSLLIISYLVNNFSKRYQFPGILILIFLGMGLRNGLNRFDVDPYPYLFNTLELIGILGLIMIILEATMHIRLVKDHKQLLIRSFLMAFINLILLIFAVGLLFHFTMNVGYVIAFLYAIPFSVVGSTLHMAGLTQLTENRRKFLIYESGFSDILSILLAFMLIEFNRLNPGDAGLRIFTNMSITIVISIIVGYGLIWMLKHVDTKVKLIPLVSVLVILFAIGKIFHLFPLIILLIFGLMLNNHPIFFRKKLSRLIREDLLVNVQRDFSMVVGESSFIVRTFFFIVFGMSINLSGLKNEKVLFLSLVILILAYLLRGILLRVVTGKHITPQVWIAPRGLVSLLLFFSIPATLHIPQFDAGILLTVILITGLIMFISTMLRKKDFDEQRHLHFDNFDELDRQLEELNPGLNKTSESH